VKDSRQVVLVRPAEHVVVQCELGCCCPCFVGLALDRLNSLKQRRLARRRCWPNGCHLVLGGWMCGNQACHLLLGGCNLRQQDELSRQKLACISSEMLPTFPTSVNGARGLVQNPPR
jgi:hypothetical protein